MQWPCPPPSPERPVPTADGARNPIRYLNDGVSQTLYTAPDGGVPEARIRHPEPSCAVLRPAAHGPVPEMPDDDYPILLNTGRLAHQWHDDQNRAGQEAQQTQPGTVRRDPSR